MRRDESRRWRGGSSDVRWKTVPQMSGCNRKCSCHWQWIAMTARCIGPEMLVKGTVVVIWLQCLLIDVLHHTRMLAHQTMLTLTYIHKILCIKTARQSAQWSWLNSGLTWSNLDEENTSLAEYQPSCLSSLLTEVIAEVHTGYSHVLVTPPNWLLPCSMHLLYKFIK